MIPLIQISNICLFAGNLFENFEKQIHKNTQSKNYQPET